MTQKTRHPGVYLGGPIHQEGPLHIASIHYLNRNGFPFVPTQQPQILQFARFLVLDDEFIAIEDRPKHVLKGSFGVAVTG